MSLFQPGHKPLHIPTVAREVFDVTGAGDTVVGVLALALAVGVPCRRRRSGRTSPPESLSANSGRSRSPRASSSPRSRHSQLP